MAVLDIVREETSVEETGRGRDAMADAEDAIPVQVESNSNSEMNERKRKLPALRSVKGIGSNGLSWSLREPRPGLCQALPSEEAAADVESSVCLSSTGIANSAVPSYQSEVCKDDEEFVMVSADVAPHQQIGLVNDVWRVPPLPAINKVSLRLVESASNLGRRLTNFVEENVTRDIRQNLIEPISGTSGDAESHTPVLEHERISVKLPLRITPTSPTFAEINARLIDNASLLSNLSVERAASLFTSTGAAMVGMGQQFLSVPPAVWNGLVTRVQTTLRGSADDIGWLLNTPGCPSAEDGTDEFLKALEQIGRGVHVLPNNLTFLLVPGLFSNHGPLYFFDTKKHFTKLGLHCHIANIHSESAVEKNAREIKDHIEELFCSTGRKVVMLGHSKGGVDAAAACSMFWPQLKDKVVGLVLVQSPYSGSPIASDILREGQIADFETRRIMEILICKIMKGDMQSLEDLTYEKRRKFLFRHSLPPDVPVVSFHTEASRAPRAVSVMSHVAHAQLPWLPGTSRSQVDTNDCEGPGKLHVAVPLAATMAICALHLELRYGEKSDGLVMRKDAEVPGSIVVKPEKKLDHAWMVYAPSRREPNEPDAAQMCEALIAVLLNHPRWRREDISASPGHQGDEVADVGALTAPLTPQNKEDSDFLTTEAARSFLGDQPETTDGAQEGPVRHFLNTNNTLEPELVGASESGRGENVQNNNVHGHATTAARSFSSDKASENTSRVQGVEGEQSLELQRHLSDVVVWETIAQALGGEANAGLGAFQDQKLQGVSSMNTNPVMQQKHKEVGLQESPAPENKPSEDGT